MKRLITLLALFCLCIVVNATGIQVFGNNLASGTTYTSSTNDKFSKIITSGSITWDASKQELTLDGLTLTGSGANAIWINNDAEIKIVLKGLNKITVSGAKSAIAIGGTAGCSIVYTGTTGAGYLTVTTDGLKSDGTVNSEIAAIESRGSLTFNRVNITAEGPSGIKCSRKATDTGSFSFSVSSSTVKATGDKNGSIYGFDSAVLTNSVNDPDDRYSYSTSKKAYINLGNTVSRNQVKIWRKYPLTVVGKAVTDKNCSDIMGDGSESVKFINAGYPSGTLILKDANITYNSGNIIEIDKDIAKFYIYVQGTNTLETTGYVLLSKSPVLFYSGSTSTRGKIITANNASVGYFCDYDLTFQRIDLTVTAQRCFDTMNSKAKLTFESNSILNAASDKTSASEIVRNFGSVNITGSYITTPKALEYVTTNNYNSYYRSFGNKIYELQISEGTDNIAPTANPTSSSITVTDLTSTSVRLTWLAAEDNMTSKSKLKYKIFCSDSSNKVIDNKETTGQTTVDFINLSPGEKYTFKVYAFDENNKSAKIATSEYRMPVEGYHVYIAGKQITNANISSYRSGDYIFDPNTYTLTLKNSLSSNGVALKADAYGDKQLTIWLAGSCTIESRDSNAIQLGMPTKILGFKNTLTVKAPSATGVLHSNKLHIEDCTVNVTAADYAFKGGKYSDGLTFSAYSSNITASGGTAAYYNYKYVYLLNCFLKSPTKAFFNGKTAGLSGFTTLNGTLCKNVVLSQDTLSVVGTVGQNSFTVGWKKATDYNPAATNLLYKMYIYEDGPYEIYNAQPKDTLLNISSYTFTGLKANTAYRVDVKVSDGNGNIASFPRLIVKTAPEASIAKGDFNEDGDVDINDMTLLIDLLNAGKAGEISMVYDLNNDGVIDEKDVEALADILLGK